MQFVYAAVEKRLYQHFQEDKRRAEQEALTIFCKAQSAEDLNMRRALFRFVKAEEDRKLINSALAAFPEELQRFAKLKYASNLSVVKQGLELCISCGQLNRWQHRILDAIWSIMQYKLTRQDVFYPQKIISVIESLATLIAVYTEFDPQHKIISATTIEGLEAYHTSYRKLINELNSRLNHPEQDKENIAVATYVNHPHEKREQLARIAGITLATFSKHLRWYEDSVAEYVFS